MTEIRYSLRPWVHFMRRRMQQSPHRSRCILEVAVVVGLCLRLVPVRTSQAPVVYNAQWWSPIRGSDAQQLRRYHRHATASACVATQVTFNRTHADGADAREPSNPHGSLGCLSPSLTLCGPPSRGVLG
jgi:hypothetical protein